MHVKRPDRVCDATLQQEETGLLGTRLLLGGRQTWSLLWCQKAKNCWEETPHVSARQRACHGGMSKVHGSQRKELPVVQAEAMSTNIKHTEFSPY